MTDPMPRRDERDFRPLSREELDALAGQELPEWAAMSLEANVAIPIDPAVAASVLSDDAVAPADATPPTDIDHIN